MHSNRENRGGNGPPTDTDDVPFAEVEVVETTAIVRPSSAPLSGVEAQISCARRFPRDAVRAIEAAIAIATADDEVAANCFYRLPIDGKEVEGLSVRAAEILARSWGNLRIQAMVGEEGEKAVSAHGMAWDLETNTAIDVMATRAIMDRYGKRYKDSTVQTTQRAVLSIALRNAILRLVPPHHLAQFVGAVKAKLLPPAAQVVAKVEDMLKFLERAYGVSLVQVCASLGRNSAAEITAEDVVCVRGWVTAIREGDTTADEVFKLAPRGAAGFAAKVSTLERDTAPPVVIETPTTPANTAPKARISEDPPFTPSRTASPAPTVAPKPTPGRSTDAEIDALFAPNRPTKTNTTAKPAGKSRGRKAVSQ